MKGRKNSGSIQRKIKRIIDTVETKTVVYDPVKERDVAWAQKENNNMTRLGFELVEYYVNCSDGLENSITTTYLAQIPNVLPILKQTVPSFTIKEDAVLIDAIDLDDYFNDSDADPNIAILLPQYFCR